MKKIEEELDKVRELLQDSDFLNGRGLSNEENIRIFGYAPENEMAVRHFIERLEIDQTLPCRLKICDLYELLLEICEDMDIADAIPEMEESDGSDFLQEQLELAIQKNDFVMKIQEKADGYDVLMLTGVGKVFPFMRIHSLLEALQPYFSKTPILVMYPGTFNKYQVQLFNRLKPNDYYRAFKAI